MLCCSARGFVTLRHLAERMRANDLLLLLPRVAEEAMEKLTQLHTR